MKALTLHQPWASFVALGVKTVETRSYPTKYRGALAIHAGLHRTDTPVHFPRLWSVGATRDEQEQANRRAWLCINTITDPAHQRPHRTDIRDRVPERSTTPTLFFPTDGPWSRPSKLKDGTMGSETMVLPMGAVIATCTLVDCVPIIDPEFCAFNGDHDSLHPTAHAAIDGQVIVHRPDARMHTTVLVEKAFGDYTPGRWAWVLADIERIEPVPAKGHQQLWDWDRNEGQ